MKKLLFYAAMSLLLGCFIFSGVKIWTIYREYQVSHDTYEDLTQHISIPASTSKTEPAPELEPTPENTSETMIPVFTNEGNEVAWPKIDFDSLTAINSDIVGWIYIEGTSINYPIVQGDNNGYYLERLFDGTRNSAGSIFLDCDNAPDFTARNSVVYGHNMKNDTMFSELTNYKSQMFFDEHPVALLMTPQGNYQVFLFSGYVAQTNWSAWDLDFDEDLYEQWLSEISSRSVFASDATPCADSRILTMSTCSYEFSNARFVVHGILVGV